MIWALLLILFVGAFLIFGRRKKKAPDKPKDFRAELM